MKPLMYIQMLLLQNHQQNIHIYIFIYITKAMQKEGT